MAQPSEGDMLLRLVSTFPRSGGAQPADPVATGVPVVPGKSAPSTVKPKGGIAELFRSLFASAPRGTTSEVASAPIGNLTVDPGGATRTQSVSPPPATSAGSTEDAAQPLQAQPTAVPPNIIPLLQTIVLESIDVSVLPRAAGGESLNGSVPARRLSADPKESGLLAAADESTASAPSSGFFAGVIRDMLGILSEKVTKKETSVQKENLPSEMKTDAARVVPDPVVMDLPVGPVKKGGADRSQESQPLPAPGITPAAHQQVDLAALRTGQGALNTPGIPDRLESASPAAPLREVPAPYAQLPPEISRRIADQVMGKLKLQVAGGVSEIRMILKPPSLGEVQLSVHVEDSRMQAQISVSQQVVKTALEAHMPQLRLALQEHGIEIQRIDVTVPEQSLHRDGTGPGGDQSGRKGGRRSFSGDDPEGYQGVKDMGYNTIELIM